MWLFAGTRRWGLAFILYSAVTLTSGCSGAEECRLVCRDGDLWSTCSSALPDLTCGEFQHCEVSTATGNAECVADDRECRLVCRDGDLWSTCSSSATPYKTCGEFQRCEVSTVTGNAGCVADTPTEVGASFIYTSMPDQFVLAGFPHIVFDLTDPPAKDTCVSSLDEPAGLLRTVEVREVILANLDNGRRGRLEIIEAGTLAPFYHFFQDGTYDPDAAAGTNLEFRVEGDNGVPSFEVAFVVPVPIHELQPLPHADGLIDFGRSEGAVFTWDRSPQEGDRVEFVMSGRNADRDGGRRTVCELEDDGVFSVPVSELMRFAGGHLTISITRLRSHRFARPGLTGNGLVVAQHIYIPIDPETMGGIPLIYQID